MVSSVLNEGARGLANSQRDIQRAANDIARANIRPEASTPPEIQRDNQSTTLAPIEQSEPSERRQDINEPLVELRRQELVFNASAAVVRTADDTLGTLLDTQA
ncbi:hypothetical protein [Agaribacterium haliotis]|uniref:hypothetical protein n=1 Tax=Agaribacterium haliotis TaxID=2013869 RepID=UPI000BB5518D|nr:hypothetical protein [Agaribacterium haliotis]